MMFSNAYSFVFFIYSLVAFACGSDDDFAEMKQMIVKVIEENAILKNEVASIRGQCMRDQIENKVEIHELRDEVETINFRLEGVQQGNTTLEQKINHVLWSCATSHH